MKIRTSTTTTTQEILILAVMSVFVTFGGVASGQQGSARALSANFRGEKRIEQIRGIDVPFTPGPFDNQGKVHQAHPKSPTSTHLQRLTGLGLEGKIRANQGKSRPTGARQLFSQPQISAGTTALASTAAPLSVEFPGIHQTDGTIPPDVGMAAGPVNVVAVSNSVISIYDKSGNLLSSETLATLFSALGGVATQDAIFDPHVVYDPYINRFWLYTVSENDALARATLLIAVSNSDDLSAGWWVYGLDATLDGVTPTNNWCDYPQVGFDAQAVYFSCNMFSFPSTIGAFQESKVRILLKTELVNNNVTGWYDFFAFTNAGDVSFTIAPAIMHGATDLDGEYLVNAQGGGGAGAGLTVWQITNAQDCCNGSAVGPNLNGILVGVGAFDTPPGAQQPGGAIPINTGDTRLLFSTWQAGHLSTGHNNTCLNSGVSSSCATFDELDVTNFPAVGVINDWALTNTTAGVAYYYPAVEQNLNGDKAMVYSRSGPAEFAGADFVGIPNSNTCTYCLDGAENTLAAGGGTYVLLDNNGSNRWGDYFSAASDPDGVGIWVAGEFANADNTWNTEIGLAFESQGPTYTLTVNLVGTGRGSVASTPAGIVCPALCADSFTSGSLVTLIATPASGSTFAGWGGVCTGTGSCVVAMNSAQSVTASFNKSSFTLSVTRAGTGSGSVSSSPTGIACPAACTATYPSGTAVTLTAAASGSFFAGWSGACSGTGSCLITMNSNQSVIATFDPLAPAVSLSSASLTFPGQLVNTTNTGQSVTLTNSGTAALLISSITASGNFSESNACPVSPSTLAPGAHCSITITFTPTVIGSIPGEIAIRDNAGNSPQLINLSGTGLGPVSMTPASLSFGAATVGSSSAAKTVTITNNLSTSLTVGFAASGDYSAVGSGTSPCGSTLAGKAKCTLSVSFKPTINGAINGAVTVTYNASFSPREVALSGAGTGGISATLGFSPASLSFSNVLVGTTSASKTVTVTNTSTSAISISALAASGNYAAAGAGTAPCGGTLAAGGKCTFAVTLSPSVNGVIVGSVTVRNSSAVSTDIYNLTGVAVLPVRFSPASLSFATQTIGTTSTTQTVTMFNDENSTLTIVGIVASGQFTAVRSASTPCGSSLPALGNCSFSVGFSPATTGAISGVVTVNYGAGFSPVELKLAGTGQ